MKCALLDDDWSYQNILLKQLQNNHFSCQLDLFYYPKDLLQSKTLHQYDVIFLDIEMPDMDGVTLANALHENNISAMIVFITNRSDVVLHAFGLNIIGFVEKSRITEQLPRILKKIKNELNQKKYITLAEEHNDFIRIKPEDVICCEIVLRNIYLYTKDKKKRRLKYTTINEVYKLFPEDSFIFVNRSVFVNINKTTEITDSTLILEDFDQSIDISRNKRKDVKDAFIRNTSF